MISRGKGLIAGGLAAGALAAGGCSGESGEQLRVGSDEWVELAAPATQTYKSLWGDTIESTLPAGESCVITRDEGLSINEGNEVTYHTDDEITGTGCPDGAKLAMDPLEAERQNSVWITWDATRKDINNQISEMGKKPLGGILEVSDWVDIVNSGSLTQRYRGSDAEIEFGESCFLDTNEATAHKVGALSTGEVVYRIERNPDEITGTGCPNGALFTEPNVLEEFNS